MRDAGHTIAPRLPTLLLSWTGSLTAIVAARPLVRLRSSRRWLAAPSTAGKRLLIVATRAEFDILAPFVAHKQKLLPTELVGLEDVLKGSKGADDAEKLKRYLYDRWKKHQLGYVLLAARRRR